MTINDGLPRSLSELNSRPSRWCIRVPRENEYVLIDMPASVECISGLDNNVEVMAHLYGYLTVTTTTTAAAVYG